LKAEEMQIVSHDREELIDITALVEAFVSKSNIVDGTVLIFVPHTTAAVTINENADPDVKRDILYKLNKEFPLSDGYRHGEGNSDAHIKSSLVGPSLQVIVSDKRLLLGTWQSIYFCEFDGPRTRKIYLKAMAG
jgi:secondary thiamine-phosphate synthase enzyme